jgi:AraC-like DNA-binding protein
MELSALNILSVIIAFEATLFSIYILSLQVERKISNFFIAFYIFIFGLESVNPLFYQFYFINHPQYAMILDSLFYLELPLIFLYIKAASFKDFKLKIIDCVHLVPFAIAGTIIVFVYHLKPVDIQKKLITSSEVTNEWFLQLLYVLLIGQAIVYSILSLIELHKYKQIVYENYSDISKHNYKWMRRLILAFVFIFIIASVRNVSIYFLPESVHDALFVFLKLIVLIFINWVIYMALKRPYLFSGVNSQIKLIDELIKEKEANMEMELDFILTAKEENLRIRLEKYMTEEKPYLNPSLSLHDLAMQLNVSTRELSVLINKSYKMHYFDFVNSYRVNNAIRILANPTDDKLTILEIMYEVGFNSKSSFNTAFKKHTKLTPSAYKAKHFKSAK